MSDFRPVTVLLKEQTHYGTDETTTTVLGVYTDQPALDDRLGRIRKANNQYPMRSVGEGVWRLGPDDDEGFFAPKPIYIRTVTSKLYGS